MTVSTKIVSSDPTEACVSEASVSALQQTNECSTELSDTAGSSIQKIMPPTHVVKNHPPSSILEMFTVASLLEGRIELLSPIILLNK